MKIKVSDYLIKRLAGLGITDIFGLPGDYNFNILDSVVNNPNTNWINCTNELNAAYAADGYARIKGYGAVITTFGVGELSAINGIAGAYSENVPVIKIAGVPKTACIKSNVPVHHNFSEPDYYAFERIYQNVTSTTAYLTEDNAKSEIDRVIETFVKFKKPVYIALPVDICNHLIDDKIPEIYIKSNPDNLKAAAQKIVSLINAAKNPLIMTDYLMKRFRLQKELNSFVDKYNLRITSMIMGKGLIDEDNRNFIGVNHGALGNEEFRIIYEGSDLVLCFGTLFSDLNTLGFVVKPDERFRVDIQSNYTIIDGERYENVLIDELMSTLLNSSSLKPKAQYLPVFHGYRNVEVSNNHLKVDEIFPLIQDFLDENDTIIVETGIISFPGSNIRLKKSSNYISQTMWGSIGWATPASFGAAMADRSKRPILFTGEGSHQLTVQELANMFKFGIKPVIFVLNNSGYTIERVLSNNPDDVFNNITSWDYKKALEFFNLNEGKYFYHSVKTSKELKSALDLTREEQKEGLVYIEMFTDKMDIPEILVRAKNCIK